MKLLDKRRRYVSDVEIITYDKILETQSHRLSAIIAPTLIEVASLRLEELGSISSADFPRMSSAANTPMHSSSVFARAKQDG